MSVQNAEKLNYQDEFFDFVNCQGVIHHTPNTQAAIKEIARVLKKGGVAHISVYYKNFFFRNWKKISFLGPWLHKLGHRFKGRERETIFLESDVNEVCRLYDGRENPIGKCYTKQEIFSLVEPYFLIENFFLFLFPARALPIQIPKFFHRFCDSHLGFMIHLNLRKK